MPKSPRNRSLDDRRAEFERLALPLAATLHRTARRLSRRPEDAADLVQETFLRAYRTFDNFQHGTNAKAWLFTILYSIVKNVWRRERRTPEHQSIDDIDARFSQVLASVDGNAERDLLARLDASSEVESALRQLPDAFRAAILLVDVEDLSYEEAASAMECPVGTVRSRLARGRKLLFVALRDYGQRTSAQQE